MRRIEVLKICDWSWKNMSPAMREEFPGGKVEPENATPALARRVAFEANVPITDVRFVRLDTPAPPRVRPNFFVHEMLHEPERVEPFKVDVPPPTEFTAKGNRYVQGGPGLSSEEPPKLSQLADHLSIIIDLQRALYWAEAQDWLRALEKVTEAQRYIIAELVKEKRKP